MALPPPENPPANPPAVLWTSLPGGETPVSVTSAGPGSLGARAFAALAFRDVIIDTVLELAAGDPDTGYGVFFRQVEERTYLAFTVTPDGRSAVFVVEDGRPRALAEGVLPADAPFARGTGAANRLTVIAAGPSITCLVNDFILVGVIADPRFKAGVAGALVVHAGNAPDARAAIRWAQVRAILPDR